MNDILAYAKMIKLMVSLKLFNVPREISNGNMLVVKIDNLFTSNMPIIVGLVPSAKLRATNHINKSAHCLVGLRKGIPNMTS